MRINELSYLLLISVAASGCIITKDMQDMASDGESDSANSDSDTAETGGEDTDGGGDGDGGSATSGNTASATSMGDGDATATTGVDPTATSAGDSDITATASSATGFEDDGTDTDFDDPTLCENSEGVWDLGACGHYECGLPNECEAEIPGCNCGYLMNWADGLGCVEDDVCLDATFACGDSLSCSVGLQYCEIFHPGVPGDPSYTCMDLPSECLSDHTCECVAPEPGPTMCELGGEGGITVEIFGA